MMRRILVCGVAAALAAAAGGAVADLYLWKDPATGRVHLYSYPPPWYGNQALERRAPRVERIPEPQRTPGVESEPLPAPVTKPRPATVPAGPGAPPPLMMKLPADGPR